jgi:hypothetical protein
VHTGHTYTKESNPLADHSRPVVGGAATRATAGTRTMSDHVPVELALSLVALDPNDPERVAALSHAEHCAVCAERLRKRRSAAAADRRQT